MATPRRHSLSPFRKKVSSNPTSTPANFTPMPGQTMMPMQTDMPPSTPQVAPNSVVNNSTPMISTQTGQQPGSTQPSTPPMTPMSQEPITNIQPPQAPNIQTPPVAAPISAGPAKPPVTPSPQKAVKAEEIQVPINTSEDMIPYMMTNQNFNVGNQEEYKKAQSRINAMNLMGHQEPKTLARMIESGRFSRADNLVTDLAKFNPEFYDQVRQEIKNEKTLKYLNKLTDNIMKNQSTMPLKSGQQKYTSEEQVEPSAIDQFNASTYDKLAEKYGENAANYISIAQQTMQSPEIQAQAQKVRDASVERAKIQAAIDQIEGDVRKQLGSEVLDSIASGYIARQTKDLTNRLQGAIDIETAENDLLKSLREDAMNTMDFFIKGQQMDFQQQQFAAQQAQQERVFQADEAQRLFSNQLDLQKLALSATPDWKAVPGQDGLLYSTGPDGQPQFKSAPQQPSFTPSGQIVSVNIPTMHEGGINAQIDQVAAVPLQQAFQEMAAMGLKPAVNQAEGTYRTHEQQQALYNKLHGTGAKVAPAGKSEHNTGLAIDISNVTPEMAAIMNKYGFYQTAGSGDAGHFAFQGGQQGVPRYTADEMEGIELPDKMRVDQVGSFTFGNRMNKSNEQITSYEDAFVNRSGRGQLYQSWTPQILKSDDQKSFDLYKKNWITASLRQESGASIAPSEFESEEVKYFAQPGDSREVVEQKRQQRDFATRQMYIKAGNDARGNPIVGYYKSPALNANSSAGSDTDL